MPTFSPPTALDNPAVTDTWHDPQIRREDRLLARRLFRYYDPKERGRTVLRVAGVYATFDSPTTDQVASASEVYLGGHVYTIDQATADRLTAAGYTVTGDVTGATWGTYDPAMFWGELVGYLWGEL